VYGRAMGKGALWLVSPLSLRWLPGLWTSLVRPCFPAVYSLAKEYPKGHELAWLGFFGKQTKINHCLFFVPLLVPIFFPLSTPVRSMLRPFYNYAVQHSFT
jgi:hypothetical protein